MNKKVAILTYPTKHRKTYELISLLKANGYSDVIAFAIPFHYKKKVFPIYQHRPEMLFSVPELEMICHNFGYGYKCGELSSFEIEKDRVVIIGGAGILDESFVKNHTVINSHPGFIPDCRGLDAFKWAIVEDKPIGVTTHLIGDYVDAGLVIERRNIPIFQSDTFHSLAQRVYENEITMLVEAVEKYDKSDLRMIEPGDSVVHRRMPKDVEKDIMKCFEEYKNRHAME